MPKDVSRTGHYATRTKTAIPHGAPCVEGGIAGIGLKQKAPGWATPFADVKTIAIGEDFLIRHTGTVEVAELAGAIKGQAVYITTATDALTLTPPGAGTGFPFGRVADLPGQRGTPTGRMMVNLDLKDNVNTA